MLGLNLLLRFGLRHFQAQGAVLVAGVNVGILHVLANVEATRARAGVAFATQPAAVVVLVLVRAVAMRGNGQIAVLQVQRNVVPLEALLETARNGGFPLFSNGFQAFLFHSNSLQITSFLYKTWAKCGHGIKGTCAVARMLRPQRFPLECRWSEARRHCSCAARCPCEGI